MIIVDVESTGVDSRLCSLLSVGAVDFNNPGNQFYMECRAFEGSHVEKEALKIAGFSSEQIHDAAKKTDREVVVAFLKWMKGCGEWTLAGQNPSFDRDFLQETAHRYHLDWPLAHRTIDLHSIAYYEFVRLGKDIPRKNNHSALNLDRILEHVGLRSRDESHNALNDAKLESEAFSRLVYGKNLLTEYSSFPIPPRL
ncbi:MAG: Exonuclease RNase T and DNA polymerase III [Parcubacteria group bacterium GW2011_GWA2_47_64]|nr:MAG: Exonuclease RNase T and DNA polymerase III [Parcubacteria group bacterium GW2011_GWA2_47_64]KKU96760.1 MAG: Exonuclease RNase T and DNA polymerase III [Parcubacteria group bacterium GW2011_GWC2_48_17]